MNTPDDDGKDLVVHLSRALDGEPAMRSLPVDDLDRGRRLLRRRRRSSVTAGAAAVSVLALGGWALSGTAGGAGTGTTELRPAGAPVVGAGSPDRSEPTGTITANCGSAPAGGTHLGVAAGSAGNSAASDCTAVDGDPVATPGIDRVTKVLTDRLDPSGEHIGSSVGGSVLGVAGSGGSDGDQLVAISVGGEWSDAGAAGSVSLSVSDSSVVLPSDPPCADGSVVGGPEVTCEQRVLDDGTTVLVGRGQLDGAERITVRYDRPDGTVVIATADQATEQWWTDGTGASPLAAVPATVDQLIDVVLDPGARL